MKKIGFFVCILVLFMGCTSKIKTTYKLKLVKEIKLNIVEPSGITAFNNNLYIVSDRKGILYKTTLDGQILKKYKTKYNDLEGVTIDVATRQFWLVNESKRGLVTLDSLGNFIKKNKVKGKQKNRNSGLEGVCFVENDSSLYVINEKSPTQLLRLNLNGEITNKFKLDFSSDISGICFDKKSNCFWFVSDESESIYKTDKKGNLIESYKIPVKKAEGIVVYKNDIYVVSDSLNSLFIFKKPD